MEDAVHATISRIEGQVPSVVIVGGVERRTPNITVDAHIVY